jgi:hypothetical protein
MKPQLLQTIKFSTFLVLTWKGLLHFTSDKHYDLLFNSAINPTAFFGWILMVVGFVSLLPNVYLRTAKIHTLFFGAFVILVIDSLCGMIQKNGMIEQFIEHALQMLLPFVLFLYFQSKSKNRNWKEIMRYGLFFTFIGHGLFAIGAHEVPDNFLHMTHEILGTNDTSSRAFLMLFGLLDFIAALLIFFSSTQKIGFWYMAIWGIFTALARPLSEFNDFDSLNFYTVHLSNFIYRIPHGLVPLYFLSRVYNWQFIFGKKESIPLKF